MSAAVKVPPNADISSTTNTSSQINLENNSHGSTTTTNSNCNSGSDTIKNASSTVVGPQNKSATLTHGQHPSLNYHNRNNNLRRSFTLPRGLFLRKSGQTGPASENKNGSFLRNIFLTLGRTKSRRHKKNHDTTQATNGTTLPNSGFPPGFVPGALGLKNQGNTCFMNAIVQCLSHTDALAKYLVTDAYRVDLRRKNNWIKSGKGEVTEELAEVMRSTWLHQNALVVEEAVSRFKSAVERGAQQWRGSEQHDAQEFLLWILDRLHEDLNQAASNKYKPVKNNFGRPDEQVADEAYKNHLRCNSSIIQEIFGAQFRSSLTCPGCHRQSATFDPFLCVSLPIPQAKQECPIYVNIVYLSQQPRQVKLGFSACMNDDIKELKRLLAEDTGITEGNILLFEIDGEGFHRTFTETQLVSSLANNEAVYCMETPQVLCNESDGAYILLTWCNILVTNDGNTRVRFGSPYISQIARETGFVDLQKLLLKEMASILHPEVLISEQKDPVISIRILDGSSEGSLVDPLVEHPLYMESVDQALSLCDEDCPPHIKIHLEWTSQDKDRIIADDSESVEEHSSVTQTRLKHSEETVSTVTLEECFDLYTTAEQLSAEDSWHCPHCNRKEQGTLKMIGLWTAPDVLVVHLKRFRQALKWRVSATKISSVVEFPLEGLDLVPHVQGPHVTKKSKVDGHNIANGGPPNQASSPINVNGCFGLGSWKRASFKKNLTAVTNVNRVNTTHGINVNHVGGDDNNRENLIYDLFAVCNHHGKDVQGGHYTAYCKNPVEGSWWSFDDTRVTQLSPDEVKNASAYILFYHKRKNVNGTTHVPSQYNGYHWCRSLLKKYHKLPPSSSISNSTTNDGNCVNVVDPSVNTSVTSNGTDGETKEVVTNHSCVDSVNKSVSTPLPPSSKQPQINGYHNEATSNTFVNSNSNSLGKSSSSSSSSSGNSAPLARMEEIAIGIGMVMPKEVQIESTV